MNDTTKHVKSGHSERAHEQTIVEDAPRLWMVFGVAIVEATNQREATNKAIAGQLAESWKALDDVGGFYEPEPCAGCVSDDPAKPTAGRDAALQSLSFALLGKQCFLEVADLARLNGDDRGALHEWAASKKRWPIMPLVLATAHVAGVAGIDGQHCTKCGKTLKTADEIAGSEPSYVAKSLVGLDCDGEQPEAARPITKRGSKKTKKIDPEKERAQQAAEAESADA